MSTMIQQKQRVYEIAEAMTKGMGTAELVKTFTQKWNCCERTVFRMCSKANDFVEEKLRSREVAIMALKAEAGTGGLVKDLRSSLELEAELCKLAVHPETDLGDKLKAINILLRLRNEI